MVWPAGKGVVVATTVSESGCDRHARRGLGADTQAAKAAAYTRAEKITWPGRFMRPDIGWRAV